MFNRYEAHDLLQSLVHVARNKSHKKADEYAAALDEIRARTNALDHLQQQCFFLGLLGDPVRAKVVREATTILKGMGKAPPPPSGYGSIAQHRLLTCLSKTLSAFDALSGGMLPFNAVITR